MNSMYGDWVCIVETDDAEAFVFLLSFTETGDVTYAAGWVQSEIASFFTGHFKIDDDGVLNLEMTDNESSDTLIGTYSFDVTRDILLLTNQSGDRLSYLFEAGEPMEFSTLSSAKLSESEKLTSLSIGQEVSITVSENPTTPYGWVAVLSDETVMEFVDDEYIPDPNPCDADGVGGKHRYSFIAIGVGMCSVDMYLVRIGDSIDEAVQKESYVYMIEEYTEESKIPDTADLPQEGLPLLEYLNDPILIAFAENFEEDFPISVSVRHDGEASGTPTTVTDPETIRAVFEALRNITVLGDWPVSGHTDDYLNYYFEMPDGKFVYGFEFQDSMLLDSWMGLHEITGFDTLQRALPDPGVW